VNSSRSWTIELFCLTSAMKSRITSNPCNCRLGASPASTYSSSLQTTAPLTCPLAQPAASPPRKQIPRLRHCAPRSAAWPPRRAETLATRDVSWDEKPAPPRDLWAIRDATSKVDAQDEELAARCTGDPRLLGTDRSAARHRTIRRGSPRKPAHALPKAPRRPVPEQQLRCRSVVVDRILLAAHLLAHQVPEHARTGPGRGEQ
jgi:hypothetical protein